MNYIIDSLIESYCTEEFKSLFEEVKQIVDAFEYEGLEDALTDVAMQAESLDDLAVFDMIYQKTAEALSYILKNHEIELNDNATLSHIVVVADAILRMQNWTDHENIIRITETSEEPEEKFASLVSLVSTAKSEDIFNVVDTVPNSFIRMLEEMHKKYSFMEDAEYSDQYISNLKSLRDFYKSAHELVSSKVLAFQLVRHGVKLGGNFDFYHSQVQKRLTGDDITYLSLQLFALLWLGADSSENVLGYWRENNERLLDSLESISKVDIEINKLLVAFDKWKSEVREPLELV